MHWQNSTKEYGGTIQATKLWCIWPIPKSTSDLISRASITDSKIVDTPIEYNCCLNSHDVESLSDATLYRQLVGSLIYLIVTRPSIFYAVHVVSQFMAAPRSPHYAAFLRIL